MQRQLSRQQNTVRCELRPLNLAFLPLTGAAAQASLKRSDTNTYMYASSKPFPHNYDNLLRLKR